MRKYALSCIFLLILLTQALNAAAQNNSVSAMQLLQIAAEQGNTYAQHSLGLIFRDGIGLPQDQALAAEWFQKAAEQGDADAQKALAQLKAGASAQAGKKRDAELRQAELQRQQEAQRQAREEAERRREHEAQEKAQERARKENEQKAEAIRCVEYEKQIVQKYNDSAISILKNQHYKGDSDNYRQIGEALDKAFTNGKYKIISSNNDASIKIEFTGTANYGPAGAQTKSLFRFAFSWRPDCNKKGEGIQFGEPFVSINDDLTENQALFMFFSGSMNQLQKMEAERKKLLNDIFLK